MKKRHSLLIFVCALCVALAACFVLVGNRQHVANLAQQIVKSDTAGTNVQTDIIKLKSYAASHMKVNVSFVLTGSYNRDVQQAKAQAAQSNSTYGAAQASCDKRGVDSIRQANCVAAYLAAHGGQAAAPQLPKVNAYQYHIIGPAWTFDIAGLLLVVAAILAIVAVASAVHRAVTK